MHTNAVIILQKELLQTSPPSKAVGYKREQPQLVIKAIVFVCEISQDVITQQKMTLIITNHKKDYKKHSLVVLVSAPRFLNNTK